MIPDHAGIKAFVRALNTKHAAHGWDQPPALWTMYGATVPLPGTFRAGVITSVLWPIPPNLFALDPLKMLEILAAELRAPKRWYSKLSPPVEYAKRCAGPQFAGVALVVESEVQLVGETQLRDLRSVFAADCAGRVTVQTELRDGPITMYTEDEFYEAHTIASPGVILPHLRDIVLGILRHCPDDAADRTAVQLIGALS